MRHPEITEQDKWSCAGFILQICACTRNVSNFKTQNRQIAFKWIFYGRFLGAYLTQTSNYKAKYKHRNSLNV